MNDPAHRGRHGNTQSRHTTWQTITRVGVLIATVAALAACVAPPQITCADGRLCPEGTVCDLVHDQCLSPHQLESCVGRLDDETCLIDGLAIGVCQDAVCLRPTCGDGVRNASEICDLDDFSGSSCQTFGYYEGGLSCEASCGAVSTADCGAYCGDGIVNGNELCDGLDQVESCTNLNAYGGSISCNAYCQPTSERCQWGRWRVVDSGSTSLLNGVWGSSDDIWSSSSSDDIWAIGAEGTIRHYDGHRWDQVDLGVGSWFYAIWGRSSDDVWAVGLGGTIWHFDGNAWDKVDPGLVAPGELAPHLWAVWGNSDELWIVGDAGTVWVHYGTGWKAIDLGTREPLYGIAGRGHSDMWIVGAGGVVRRENSAAGWQTLDVDDALVLTGVAVPDIRGAWIVGNGGILHHDGISAQSVGLQGAFWSVWATSPDDVWAVGYEGVSAHFDGVQWVDVPSGSTTELTSVWASSRRDVWAVGSRGTVLRHDGEGWTATTSPSVADLRSVHAVGDEVWIGGEDGTLIGKVGAGWQQATVDGPPLDGSLTVWAGRPEHIWAASSEGGIFHRFDGRWTRDTTFPASSFYALWGSSFDRGVEGRIDDIWAIGTGAFAHYNGRAWTLVAVPADWRLDHLWGSRADDIWAIGYEGLFVHYDGATWEEVAVDAIDGDRLQGVWGNGPDDVWVVGDGGAVFRYDGTAWTRHDAGTVGQLLGIWGSGPGDIWVVGARGLVRHFDGISWSAVDAGTQATLIAVHGTGPDDVWAVGADGAVFHLAQRMATLDGGSCHEPMPIYCGATVHGTITRAAPLTLEDHACIDYPTPGREVYYRLENPVSGQLHVELTTRGKLELVVTGADADRGCGSCLAADAAEAGPASVTVPASQGDTLYVIVDGRYYDQVASYTLTLTCVKD